MLQKRDRPSLLVFQKRESHLKTYKNKLSAVTETDQPKTSSLVKARWNNFFMVKFQNLKPKGN